MKFIFEHSINMTSNILTKSNNDSCKVTIGHIQGYPMASTTTCLGGGKGYKKKFLESKNQPIKFLHVSKLVNFAKVLTNFKYLK